MAVTLPLIGSVMDVDMYTFHGVVLCVTPIGVFDMLTETGVFVTTTGKLTEVTT